MLFDRVLKVFVNNTSFNTNRCFTIYSTKLCKIDNITVDPDVITKEYDELLSNYMDTVSHRCYVLQPYIKWGAEKVRNRTPMQRLHEAVQLAGYLHNWTIAGGECFGVRNARLSLGSGQLQRLHETLNRLGNISALLVNIPLIGTSQINTLRDNLPGRPKIIDRAALVLRLVREQVVKGTHAHIQLQLAELEYITRRCSNEHERYIIMTKRVQILTQLEECRAQRELHRQRRRDANVPIISVIGYTNAGKSSLVNALVGTENVCSSNERAFHTLEVIGRAGLLPCGLRVIYMDTVGFLSDIPPLLSALFTATLEDVFLADVILHVVDMSHEEAIQQLEYVNEQLSSIYTAENQSMASIVTVGNKLDVRDGTGTLPAQWELAVSALRGTGIDALRTRLQEAVLTVTGRLAVTIKLPTGSEEVQWMFKNAVVLGQSPDKDNQYSLVKVITTKVKIEQFYAKFVKKSKKQ